MEKEQRLIQAQDTQKTSWQTEFLFQQDFEK